MKNRWALLGLAALSLVPAVVFAAGLVPCTGFDTCDLCAFGQLIQKVINYLIALSIPLAALLTAWGGFLYATSGAKPANRDRAKKIFWNTIVGFILTAGAWLIINTLLVTIVPGRSNFLTLSCAAPRERQYSGTIQGALCPLLPSLCNSASVCPQYTTLVNGQCIGNDTGVTTGPPTQYTPTPPENTPGVGSIDSALQAINAVESSNGSNVDNGNGTGCNNEGACGPYQITPATACQTNLSVPGCSGLSINSSGQVTETTPGSLQEVQNYLQDSQQSQALAKQILTNDTNSSQCNGDLACGLAMYNAGPSSASGKAFAPSACCGSALAYQCAYDCGTLVPGSYQCNTNPTSVCKPTTFETYNYVQKVLSKMQQAGSNPAQSQPTQANGGTTI